MIQTCNLWTWFKFAASKSSNMYHFPLFHYLKLLVSETHIRLKKWIQEKTFAVSQPLHSPTPPKKNKKMILYIYIYIRIIFFIGTGYPKHLLQLFHCNHFHKHWNQKKSPESSKRNIVSL